jgi:hypothetical protein
MKQMTYKFSFSRKYLEAYEFLQAQKNASAFICELIERERLGFEQQRVAVEHDELYAILKRIENKIENGVAVSQQETTSRLATSKETDSIFDFD